MAISRFFTRYHPKKSEDGGDWYEVVEQIREFPLGVPVEKHVCVLHSKATADILVAVLNRQRMEGIAEGMTRYAWWRDGVQMVGSCGTTLEQAIRELEKEFP